VTATTVHGSVYVLTIVSLMKLLTSVSAAFLAITAVLLAADSPAWTQSYIYIDTSDQGVKKYIANIRCNALPQAGIRKACIFDDLLVEPSGRQSKARMMLICDNYLFSPYGRPDMGQIARPGSLMAIAASRMC